MKNRSLFFAVLRLLILFLLINVVSNYFFFRFDATQDKRFTLASTSKKIIENISEPLLIEVYLHGNLPVEFRKLQQETKQLLEEFSKRNTQIKFIFVNPLEDSKAKEHLALKLQKLGAKALNVTINEKGKQTQEIVFPWAIVSYKGKEVKVPLLNSSVPGTIEEKIETSVGALEGALVDGFAQITLGKKKKIAVLKGIGEPSDAYIADLLLTFKERYFIAPFTLEHLWVSPEKTLSDLKLYDLLLVIQPSKAFSETEIQVLDQYVINGGKSLWLLDKVKIHSDSLSLKEGTLAYGRNIGALEMLMFKYGLRLTSNLVKDEFAAPIKLAIGQQGSQTIYQNFPWKFSPLVVPNKLHPITKNLSEVKLDFTTKLDTLANGISKTILLQSSKYSKLLPTPERISFKVINEAESSKESFQGHGNYPLAVLLEGDFVSVFNNRIRPFNQKDFSSKGKNNQMIVVSDADLAFNQMDQNQMPLETGYDKWTNTRYANKEFLLQAVNYLLNDKQLINIQNKQVYLPLLDKLAIYKDYFLIQALNLLLPMSCLIIVALIFWWWRTKKYKA